jgi:hypothetical protein
MSTTELDQKYDQLLVTAYERGVMQGTHDRLGGYHNPTPLSGEYAGESIPEILGDLIRRATMISAEMKGLGEDGMDNVDGDPYEAWQDICDNYETGYFDGNYEA